MLHLQLWATVYAKDRGIEDRLTVHANVGTRALKRRASHSENTLGSWCAQATEDRLVHAKGTKKMCVAFRGHTIGSWFTCNPKKKDRLMVHEACTKNSCCIQKAHIRLVARSKDTKQTHVAQGSHTRLMLQAKGMMQSHVYFPLHTIGSRCTRRTQNGPMLHSEDI
eukprot:1161255-Pelagomonas_calceolata.AAC.6